MPEIDVSMPSKKPVSRSGASDAAFHPLEKMTVRARSFAPPAAVLRALKAQSQCRELLVALAQPGAERPGVDGDVPAVVGRLAAAAERVLEIAAVELERLPGSEPLVAYLFGERIGVAGQVKRFLGHYAGRLVVAVAVLRAAVEAGDERQRAVDANDPDDIPQNVLFAPLPERLFQILGVAVVDQSGEILVVETVVAVGNEEFLGADQAQPVEQLGADGVGAPPLPG